MKLFFTAFFAFACLPLYGQYAIWVHGMLVATGPSKDPGMQLGVEYLVPALYLLACSAASEALSHLLGVAHSASRFVEEYAGGRNSAAQDETAHRS